MKNRAIVILSVLLILACARIAISQQSKVPPEVWQKAKIEGVVPVLVHLNVPWKPGGNLSPQELEAQMKAIAAAQKELITELTGTNYKLGGQPEFVPTIAIDVGVDALSVLERSTHVVTVTEDIPYRLPEESLPNKIP